MASQAPVNDQLWWDGPIDKAEILIQGVKMEFILNKNLCSEIMFRQ